MTTFEYLAVLISIIVGLGITHLLGGVARFIHHPDRYKFYWIHLVWVWYIFLFLIYFWWFELWFTTFEDWTSLLYAFLIVYSILLYLLCVVVLPPDSAEGVDFKEYFWKKKNWFFGFLLVAFLVDIPDTLIKGQEDLIKGHGIPNVLVGVALILIAILTKNPKYHGFLAIWLCIVLTLRLLGVPVFS